MLVGKVQIPFPSSTHTMYDVIGQPPILLGDSKEIVIVPSSSEEFYRIGLLG